MLTNRNFLNYFLHIFNGLLPTILILYLNSNSTLTFMGYFFKALAVIGTVQLFVDYGFNFSAIRTYRELSTKNISSQHRINFFFNLIYAKILIGSVILLGYISYTKLFLTHFIIADLSYIFFGVLFSVLNLNWFFYATDKILEFNFILTILRIISFLILFILPLHLDNILIVNFAPYTLSNILLMIYIGFVKFPKKITLFPKFEILKTLKSGWGIFSNGIIISFLSLGWPIFLSKFISIDMIGLYGLADRISKGLRNLIGPLPFLILSNHEQSITGFNFQSFNLKYIKILGILLICVPLIFMFVPNILLGIVLKGEVSNFRLLLNIYSLGFISGVLNTVFYSYLIRFSKESLYLIYFVIAYISGIGLGLIIGSYIYMPLFVEFILSFLLFIKFLMEYNKTKI